MEFHQKLTALRKQKGLTQAELAKVLYVSRTAISKWESGKGYPSIDILKQIAKFFSVTLDELLCQSTLAIAEQEGARSRNLFNISFSLLDITHLLLLFLPFFTARSEGSAAAVTVFNSDVQPYLKVIYLVLILCTVLVGSLTLTPIGLIKKAEKLRTYISIALALLTMLIFILSSQPYAAVFALSTLLIRFIILLKHR